MTYDDIKNLLDECNLPYAYDHFVEGESPDPPFVCLLLPGSDNFSADGVVYQKIDQVKIELYTNIKDPEIEEIIEAVLDKHGIFYNKSEVWIDSEKMYEVMFSFEIRR